MFCFSALRFFIYLYFRAVVIAFWAFVSSRHSSALCCFYCVVSVLINKLFIHSILTLIFVCYDHSSPETEGRRC